MPSESAFFGLVMDLDEGGRHSLRQTAARERRKNFVALAGAVAGIDEEWAGGLRFFYGGARRRGSRVVGGKKIGEKCGTAAFAEHHVVVCLRSSRIPPAIRNSSSVADMPRLRSTGFFGRGRRV